MSWEKKGILQNVQYMNHAYINSYHSEVKPFIIKKKTFILAIWFDRINQESFFKVVCIVFSSRTFSHMALSPSHICNLSAEGLILSKHLLLIRCPYRRERMQGPPRARYVSGAHTGTCQSWDVRAPRRADRSHAHGTRISFNARQEILSRLDCHQ